MNVEWSNYLEKDRKEDEMKEVSSKSEQYLISDSP